MIVLIKGDFLSAKFKVQSSKWGESSKFKVQSGDFCTICFAQRHKGTEFRRQIADGRLEQVIKHQWQPGTWQPGTERITNGSRERSVAQ